MRGHSEGVAAGRVQPRQFVVSLAPKVTFSENTVLLSLRRREEKGEGIKKNRRDEEGLTFQALRNRKCH